MSLKRKVLLVLAAVILVWIATPIPEVTILSAIFGFATGYTIFPDWRWALVTSIIGCGIGTILTVRLHLFSKIKEWAKHVKADM